ncbi:hypothetical protein B0H19DRAFT_1065669 [Mycena capillaripes]|nr:hypothetical protein B0H19DRAFT_1065669 [Mycena capillaripes]
MTSSTAATTAPTARDELRAVVTTVTKLLARTTALTRMAEELNEKLPAILARLNEEAAEDHVFVRVVAKTPAQVAALHANEPDGSRHWWVVYVGREPGLYTTIEAADLQIKGCPNQQYRRKASKSEALAFYAAMHADNKVEKWVELVDE